MRKCVALSLALVVIALGGCSQATIFPRRSSRELKENKEIIESDPEIYRESIVIVRVNF